MLKKIYDLFLENTNNNIVKELNSLSNFSLDINGRYDKNFFQLKERMRVFEQNHMKDNKFIFPNRYSHGSSYLFEDLFIQFTIEKEISHIYDFSFSIIHNVKKDDYTLYLGIANNTLSSEKFYICYDENFNIFKDINYVSSNVDFSYHNKNIKNDCILYKNNVIKFLINNYTNHKELLDLIQLNFDFKRNDNDIILPGLLSSLYELNKINSLEKKYNFKSII